MGNRTVVGFVAQDDVSKLPRWEHFNQSRGYQEKVREYAQDADVILSLRSEDEVLLGSDNEFDKITHLGRECFNGIVDDSGVITILELGQTSISSHVSEEQNVLAIGTGETLDKCNLIFDAVYLCTRNSKGMPVEERENLYRDAFLESGIDASEIKVDRDTFLGEDYLTVNIADFKDELDLDEERSKFKTSESHIETSSNKREFLTLGDDLHIAKNVIDGVRIDRSRSPVESFLDVLVQGVWTQVDGYAELHTDRESDVREKCQWILDQLTN